MPGPLLDPATRIEIQRIMTAGAGVLRSAASLDHAADALEALYRSAAAEADRDRGNGADDTKDTEPGVDAWEATNLLLVSRVLVAAARAREETRGCHWREDRPDRDDDTWRSHLVVRLTPGRTLAVHRTESASFPPVHLPREQ